jgi:hypothetical protein
VPRGSLVEEEGVPADGDKALLARTSRLNVMLALTRAERRAFEALCASDLRSPGQMATRIVVAHLAQRAANAASQPIPPGERIPWSLPIRLTAAQRRKLETLAATGP